MASGMWIAASAATANGQKIDTIANNLANLHTAGFKKDDLVFEEYVGALERPKTSIDIPAGPIKDAHLYPLDDRDSSHVVTQGSYTSFTEGHLQQTGRPLDVALRGDGFFEVLSPQGIRYTRAGQFHLSSNGTLVNAAGFPVLSKSDTGAGSNPAQRLIVLEPNYVPSVNITSQGQIWQQQEEKGTLSVVTFASRTGMTKEAGTLFKALDSEAPLPASQVHAVQGFLEGSNVNPMEEMTKLIQAHRMFEQDLKALNTYHHMMGKEANEIGKL